MSVHLTKHAIFLFMSITGVASTAFAGLSSTQQQNADVKDRERIFDGVWIGDDNITLITEQDESVILMGKDGISTWSAKCIRNGKKAICKGSGVDSDGREFIYESILELTNNGLRDSWKAIYSKGQEDQGVSVIKRVDIEVLMTVQQGKR